jgi:hypothetical protein
VEEKEKAMAEEKASFERIFKDSADGRTVLKVLSEECVPEIGNYEADPHRIFFNEGKRNLFMTILKLSSLSMGNFIEMYNWDNRWLKIKENVNGSQ